jgi:hypothetical protein
MITPHPRLKVNVAEQLARSIVAAAHVPSPNLVGANESRSPVGGARLFQQPARRLPRLLPTPAAVMDTACTVSVGIGMRGGADGAVAGDRRHGNDTYTRVASEEEDRLLNTKLKNICRDC